MRKHVGRAAVVLATVLMTMGATGTAAQAAPPRLLKVCMVHEFMGVDWPVWCVDV